MLAKKVPVEVSGHVERVIWVNDHVLGVAEFRLISWVNDDHGESDFLPWSGDSGIDDCPF
ncbi:MAG: hypothetical protein ACKOVA_00900 [Novosphingobium sp.]